MTKAKKKTAALLMRIRANVSTAILTYLHYLIAWFSIEVLAGNNALLWFIAYLLVAVNVSNGMRHRAILEAIANASNNDKVDSHPLYAMRHNDKIDSHPLGLTPPSPESMALMAWGLAGLAVVFGLWASR